MNINYSLKNYFSVDAIICFNLTDYTYCKTLLHSEVQVFQMKLDVRVFEEHMSPAVALRIKYDYLQSVTTKNATNRETHRQTNADTDAQGMLM